MVRLIESGLSVNPNCVVSSKNDEEQKLRDAAERGDIGEVARLIESGVSVNSNCGVSRDRTFTYFAMKSYILSQRIFYSWYTQYCC